MLEAKVLVNDLIELNIFAQIIANKLLEIEEQNIVFLFKAEMAAGKTSFTRVLAEELGIQEKITSPSFVGLNYYSTDKLDVYHYDLYQVKPSYWDTKEILESNKKKILVFEWSELLEDEFYNLLENNALVYEIRITLLDNDARDIAIKLLSNQG